MMMYKIEFGNPNPCLSTTLKLDSKFIPELINTVNFDAEDGM